MRDPGDERENEGIPNGTLIAIAVVALGALTVAVAIVNEAVGRIAAGAVAGGGALVLIVLSIVIATTRRAARRRRAT